MKTLSEKIEANADLTLWCVHILGSDEVLAAPCHEAAEVRARILNRSAHDHARSNEFADILCFAYAAPWPYDKESHAENVKDWLKS